MKVLSNAKINIALKVTGKKEDGYHTLDMVNVPLALHDIIEIDILDDEYETNVEFDDYSIPLGEQNTINKAIKILRDRFGFKEEFDIFVEKHIPTESGLGGGSSNAAFVLKAIVELLKLPISEQELIELAANIGADIPYFIINKPARVQGIGEHITPFEIKDKPYVLLVKPFIGCSTKEVFQKYDELNIISDGNNEKVIKGLIDNDLKEVDENANNDLTLASISFLSDIERIINSLKNDGIEVVSMTGAGSTIYALSSNYDLLLEKSNYYKSIGYYTILTSII